MDVTRSILLSVLLAVHFKRSDSLIPDQSVLWSHHGDGMYFTTHLLDWITNGKLPASNVNFDSLGSQVIYGFAYSFNRNLIVHSDRSQQNLVITDVSRNISAPFFIGTSPDVGQITIDWTSGNVYWADSGFRWIAMKSLPMNISTMNSLDPGFKIIAQKYLDKPSGLAVYPDKFYLFWADEGDQPKIERSSLDGSNRRIIVWKSLIRPMSIAIDYISDRLYWSDPARRTIEVSDIDGLGRKVFASEPEFDYFGLAVYLDNLVFTVPGLNLSGIYSTATDDSYGNIKSVMFKFDTPVYDVEIYAEVEQPRQEYEPCDTTLQDIQCDQICIQTKRHQHGGFDCFCEDGNQLQNDGKSCQRVSQITERTILYTDQNRICQGDLYNLFYPPNSAAKCDAIEHVNNITRFAVEMSTDVFIFTDGEKIYREKAYNKVTKEELYTSDFGEIRDIAFNWRTGFVYWTVQGSGRLFYLNIMLGLPPVQWMAFDGSDITLVTVDPVGREVFFIKETNGIPSLHVWDGLSDSSPDSIATRHLQRPTDLEYDPANWRLLWFDKAGYMGFIDVDGSNEKTLFQMDAGETFNPAIALYKNYAILTVQDPSIQVKVLYDQRSLHGTSISTDLTYIRDLLIFDTSLQPQVSDRCEIDNGVCDHICIPDGDQPCRCYHGYTLQQDSHTCSSDYPENGEYFLVIDNQHGFMRVDNDTKDAYAVDTDAKQPSAMAFDQQRSVLMWTEPNTYVMKRQHVSDTESEVFGESFTGNGTLAVDPTSGNVYYSSMRRLGVVGLDNTVKTLLDEGRLQGPILKITLIPEYGQMAWIEGGTEPRLVQANMDGSNMVVLEVFTAEPPDDIVYDRTANDRVLYYCHSAGDKIVRQQTTLYIGSGHRPVAMDVTEEFVYFIPRYSRKIVRIHKSDVQGETIIFDSPLSGILLSLFIPSVTALDHPVCHQCNGGCSTLCLPVGETKKTCACADNDVMTAEGICGKATVCEAVHGIAGLDMSSCCHNLPGTVCFPTCSEKYTIQHEAVQCLNGNWEHNPETICKAEETDTGNGSQMAVYIGAGAGGAVALIVVIVIVIVIIVRVMRRKARKSSSRRASQLPRAADLDQRHDYDTADNFRPPVPVPRPLSQDEAADGGVYTDLDEVSMVADPDKLVVSLPQDKRRGSNSSDRKNRYSGFPKMDPYGTTRSMHDYLDLSGKDLRDKIQEEGTYNTGDTYNHGYLTALSKRDGVVSYHKPNDKVKDNPEEEPDGYLSTSSLGSGSGGGVFKLNTNHFPVHDQRQLYQGHVPNARPTAHKNRWHGNESDYLRFMNKT